jgi:glycerol-3-phosphate dehydrogenase
VRLWGSRPSLDGRRFDVVIIGGGINGVAVARECALAGKGTLLVEQHDFASGTTSRSTRIIHGGLRYLEHGEISLVRQSLRERQRLLSERPHLIRPLQFLLALPQGNTRRSALEIRLGLWLYRWLARGNRFPRERRSLSTTFESQLDAGRRWAVFPYEDAQCEFPERLVAEWLTEATAAGAVARNYTEALEVELHAGRISAVVLRDVLGDEEARVEAGTVVNASGPWVDRLCGRSGIVAAARLVDGIRGSHLVIARFPGAPEHAIYTEGTDGRPIFLVPWNGQLLLGTTEVRDNDDPARIQPAPDEIEYLLASVQRLFPHARIGATDVRSAFAGIRPLPFSPGDSPASITRRHILHDHSGEGAAGLISVIGGKLTTAAALARDCVRKLGVNVVEPHSLLLPSPACEDMTSTLDAWALMVSQQARTSIPSARAIAEWHGRRAFAVAARARYSEVARQTVCDHSDHLVAEAMEAVQSEYALTLGDILLRRVPVALGPCWSAECGRIAAQRIGTALGWNARQIATQLERFEQEREAFLNTRLLRTSRTDEASALAVRSGSSKGVA